MKTNQQTYNIKSSVVTSVLKTFSDNLIKFLISCQDKFQAIIWKFSEALRSRTCIQV